MPISSSKRTFCKDIITLSSNRFNVMDGWFWWFWKCHFTVYQLKGERSYNLWSISFECSYESINERALGNFLRNNKNWNDSLVDFHGSILNGRGFKCQMVINLNDLGVEIRQPYQKFHLISFFFITGFVLFCLAVYFVPYIQSQNFIILIENNVERLLQNLLSFSLLYTWRLTSSMCWY